MKLKIFFLLVGMMAVRAYAQSTTRPGELHLNSAVPHFGISLKYNTEDRRYEVYAQANFTSNHFILGPSQVSIVVPKQLADQPLAVYSETAIWRDYSSVYAPSAAPDVDFHGINSMGKVIDVEEGKPFMLFFFTLAGGYVNGIRLFTNGLDPNSSSTAMKGGDFSNTIQDHKGKDYYLGVFDSLQLAQLTNKPLEAGMPEVSVYPNPVTGDAFTVSTKKFAVGERLKLRLLSETGVELYSVEEDAAKLINFQVRMPKQLSGQAYLYAERKEANEGPRSFCKKLIILN